MTWSQPCKTQICHLGNYGILGKLVSLSKFVSPSNKNNNTSSRTDRENAQNVQFM